MFHCNFSVSYQCFSCDMVLPVCNGGRSCVTMFQCDFSVTNVSHVTRCCQCVTEEPVLPVCDGGAGDVEGT